LKKDGTTGRSQSTKKSSRKIRTMRDAPEDRRSLLKSRQLRQPWRRTSASGDILGMVSLKPSRLQADPRHRKPHASELATLRTYVPKLADLYQQLGSPATPSLPSRNRTAVNRPDEMRRRSISFNASSPSILRIPSAHSLAEGSRASRTSMELSRVCNRRGSARTSGTPRRRTQVFEDFCITSRPCSCAHRGDLYLLETDRTMASRLAKLQICFQATRETSTPWRC